MRALNRLLHQVLTWFSILVFVILIFDVVIGVGSRYIFGNQVRWTEELATFLLVWLVFCGAAIAYRDKAHLGIDLFVQSLHPQARKTARMIAHLIILSFTLAVMVWGGSQLTMDRMESGQMISTLGIHKAWLYLAIPFNGLFIALFNIDQMIDTLQNIDTESHEEGSSI